MDLYGIVHPGMEHIAQQELREKWGISSEQALGVVAFSLPVEKIGNFLFFSQSLRGLFLALGRASRWEDLSLSSFSWKTLPVQAYALELEHIKGEVRQKVSQKVSALLRQAWKEQGVKGKLEYPAAGASLVVHFTGKEYLMGLDLAGRELHKRSYRVFPHAAGFTGDIAYALVRKSGFVPGERMAVGFVKDGSLAIEAALFAHHLPIFPQGIVFPAQQFFPAANTSSSASLSSSASSFSPFLSPEGKEKKWQEVQGETAEESCAEDSGKNIYAFDPSRQNIIAARKNAKIAGVADLVELQRYALDELDLKWGENAFHCFLTHLTTKDEDALNEIFYQAKYLLRPGGRLLLVTRKALELSLPLEFSLLLREELARGESVQQIWVIEKKVLEKVKITKSKSSREEA